MTADAVEARTEQTQSELVSLLDQIEGLLGEVRERVLNEVIPDDGG